MYEEGQKLLYKGDKEGAFGKFLLAASMGNSDAALVLKAVFNRGVAKCGAADVVCTATSVGGASEAFFDEDYPTLKKYNSADFSIYGSNFEKYKGKSPRVLIPLGVERISYHTFDNCKTMTSVVIPETVAAISEAMFNNCPALELVEWRATECEEVRRFAYTPPDIFSQCPRLKRVIIGDAVKTLPQKLFAGCDGITDAVMPASALAHVPKSKLEYLTVTSGSIGAKDIGNNKNLKSLTVGAGVKAINETAFDGCPNIETVTWNAENCEFDGEFGACEKLATLNIGDRVQKLPGKAFASAGITKVNVASLRTWCELRFASFFENPLYPARKLLLNGEEVCGALKIPAGTTSLRSESFLNCKLTSLFVPMSVSEIELKLLSSQKDLEFVEVEEGNEKYASRDGVLYDKSGNILFVPSRLKGDIKIYDGCKVICDNAFSNRAELTSVDIPSGVKRIDSGAFAGCERLRGVVIPDSVESVESRAFANCAALCEVTVGRGVRILSDDAFENCHKLVHIRNLSGHSVKSPAKMFGEVLDSPTEEFKNKLRRSDGGILTYSVDENGVYAFGCDNETGALDLSKEKNVDGIYPYAFFKRSDLRSVNIPSGVGMIGEGAFEGCSGLGEVIIPDGVSYIEDAAFANCAGLRAVSVPDSVEEVGRAFDGCGNIAEATLPALALKFFPRENLESVTITSGEIGKKAFDRCKKLRKVVVLEQVADINKKAFSGCVAVQKATVSRRWKSKTAAIFKDSKYDIIYTYTD